MTYQIHGWHLKVFDLRSESTRFEFNNSHDRIAWLMMPVSNDAPVRAVRRRSVNHHEELSVIGIDDLAFRRCLRHGTIVCDLERRPPVTLLPDRELGTSRA